MDEPERLLAVSVEGRGLRGNDEGELSTIAGLVLGESGNRRRESGDEQKSSGDTP